MRQVTPSWVLISSEKWKVSDYRLPRRPLPCPGAPLTAAVTIISSKCHCWDSPCHATELQGAAGGGRHQMSDDQDPQRRGTTENAEPKFGGRHRSRCSDFTFFFFFFLQEEKVQLWRGLGVRRGQARVSSARG